MQQQQEEYVRSYEVSANSINFVNNVVLRQMNVIQEAITPLCWA